MQRSFLALLLLAGLTAGTIALSYLLFRGGGGGSPIDAIPASADAALIIPSVADLLRDFSATRMSPAPGESGWDHLAGLLGEMLAVRGIPFRPDAQRLSRALRGEAALAWVQSARAGSPSHLIVAFEVPPGLDGVLEYVESSVLPGLKEDGVDFERRSHRGREYGVMRFPGAREIVCVAEYRRLALITVSGEAMRQALETLSRPEGSLAANSTFRRMRRDLRERSSLIAWASGDLLREALGPESLRARFPALSGGTLAALHGAQGGCVSITVGTNGQFRERVRLFATGIHTSLPARVFSGSPSDIETARLLPEGYPLYFGLSLSDPGAVWEGLPEWLAPVLEMEPARLRDRLRGAEQFLDIDARKDLMDALGEEASIALSRSKPESFVVIVRPTGTTSLRRVLDRVDGLARSFEARSVHRIAGIDVVTWEHPTLGRYRPSYAFVDGALILAGTPEVLEPILSRREAGGGRPALESPFEGDPAHIRIRADSGSLLNLLRARGEATDEATDEGASAGAWIDRLEPLLPGLRGPIPYLNASLRFTRDGLTGEWEAPLSPVIMGCLLLAFPAQTRTEQPLIPVLDPLPAPVPEESVPPGDAPSP